MIGGGRQGTVHNRASARCAFSFALFLSVLFVDVQLLFFFFSHERIGVLPFSIPTGPGQSRATFMSHYEVLPRLRVNWHFKVGSNTW